MIPLPIQDDFDYTFNTFKDIIQYNQYYDLIITIFPLFINILTNADVTKHDSRSLSKSLTPTLCQEKISIKNNDRLVIGTRFIKNMMDHFDQIKNTINVEGNSSSAPIPDIRSPSPKARTGRTVSATGGVRIISQQQSNIPSLPPKLPKPRKLSPTKYETSSSRSSSPTKAGFVKRVSSQSSITKVPDFTPPLRNKTSNVSLRIGSDSSLPSLGTASKKSEMETSNSIKDMVTDENDNNENNDIQPASRSRLRDTKVDDLVINIRVDDKFQRFDKELQEKRKNMIKMNSVNATKFSKEGFSDIKAGSKVGKLAALYEERLQGIQAMNELKKNGGIN